MLRFAPEPHNLVGGSCLIAVFFFPEDYVIHTRIGEVPVLENWRSACAGCLLLFPTYIVLK